MIIMNVMEDFYRHNPCFDLLSFNFHNQEAVKSLRWPDGYSEKEKADTLKSLRSAARVLRLHPDAPQVLKPDGKEMQTRGKMAAMQANSQDAAGERARHVSALLGQFGGFGSARQIANYSQDHFAREFASQFGNQEKAGQIHRNAVNTTTRIAHLWAGLCQVTGPYTRAMRANNISGDIPRHFENLPGYDDLFGSQNYCECENCKSIFGPAAYFVDLMRLIDKHITNPFGTGKTRTIPVGMTLDERRPDLAKIELTCKNTNNILPYLAVVDERLRKIADDVLGHPTDLFLTLAQKYYPFHHPFQLLLQRIRNCLEITEVKLADVYKAMGAAAKDAAAETIQLSPEEWQLLTNANTSEAKLKEYYGVADLTRLSDVATFLKQTGLEYNELYQLLYQDLTDTEIKAGLNGKFFINQGLTSLLQIKEDKGTGRLTIENLNPINPIALDQIHRFLRLASKIGWTYTELDWALRCVNNGVPVMNENSLLGIAVIKELKESLKTTIPTVCALLFDLKTYGAGDDSPDSQAFFDRIYNGSGTKTYHPKDEGAYPFNPLYTDEPWQWTVGDAADKNQQIAGRIASSLNIRRDELNALAGAAFGEGQAIKLTVKQLSILYSFATMAAFIQLPILQYVKLLTLFKLTKIAFTPGIVTDIINNASLLRESGLDVFILDYIVNGAESNYVDMLYREADIDLWLKTLPKLVVSNASTEDAIKKEQYEKLTAQIATFFGVPTEQLAAILTLLEQQDSVAVFLDVTKVNEAKGIIKIISRWLVLIQKLGLKTGELESISEHKDRYGIQDPNMITPANVLDLYQIKKIMALYSDVSGDLMAAINAPEDKGAEKLARLTNYPQGQLDILLRIFNDSNWIVRIRKIKKALDICKDTGADVQCLQALGDLAGKLAGDNWEKYQQGADNVARSLSSRYTPDVWTHIYQQILAVEEGQVRTTLIGTVLNGLSIKEGAQWVENTRNLYEYLLIDVDMGECSDISYVKEGINALQLYLTRCRLNLEPGIANLDISETEWEWIMSYPKWEANRKIFLYPENYLDPSLRNTMTSLFKNLKDNLMQGEITDGAVERAYKKYFQDFAQTAKLKYVDGCCYTVHDPIRGNIDTLFLFACTGTNPNQYYYCAREGEQLWTEWKKIDIEISSRHLTPVYVFNRLFIYWVEIKEEVCSITLGGNSRKDHNYKAVIKYSFQDASNQWGRPQTLAERIVYYAKEGENGPETDQYNKIFADFFSMDNPYWHKVYPVVSSHENVNTAYQDKALKGEKLSLFYGPFIDQAQNPGVFQTNSLLTTGSFEDNLHEWAEKIKRFETTQAYLPYSNYSSVGIFQEKIPLLYDSESLMFGKDILQRNVLFKPEINTLHSCLQLVKSDNVIYDNYFANFAAVNSSYKEEQVLLGKISNSNVRTIPIKNNPDLFILDNGDEAFLFSSKKVPAGMINKQCSVCAPSVQTNSFVIFNLSPDVSSKIYSKLISSAILDNNGVPKVLDAYEIRTALDNCGQVLTNEQKTGITRLLLNYPKIFEDSFIMPNIDANLSKEIYTALKSQIIDSYGRFIPQVAANAGLDLLLAAQLQAGKIKPSQIPLIHERIFSTPRGTSFYYINRNGITDINDYTFKTTRLTTAAVYKLERSLFLGGIKGLLDLRSQQIPLKPVIPFVRLEPENTKVQWPGAIDGTQVDFDGIYGNYYWEVFFHTPWLVAQRLASEQKFLDALKWLRYVFDPTLPLELIDERTFYKETETEISEAIAKNLFEVLTSHILGDTKQAIIANGLVNPSFSPETDLSFLTKDVSGIQEGQVPQIRNILLNYRLLTPAGHYWRFQPFRGHSIESIAQMLKDSTAPLESWHNNPFDPHAIARLRIGAYEKAIVMKYIDILIAWGDSLFAVDSWEAINEAALLYIYAYNLLGPRPEKIGKCPEAPPLTYAYISEKYKGEVPEFLLELETLVSGSARVSAKLPGVPINALDVYFCVPENQQLLSYWDRVEDRLYKIRHCMNLEGAARRLALFEPSINPMELVKMASTTNGIMSIGQYQAVDVPYYRFWQISEKAKGVCAALMQFGSALLMALEKADAEALALLRSKQEQNILAMTTLIKENQIDEINETIASLEESKNSAQYRYEYYRKLHDNDLSALEVTDIVLRDAAIYYQIAANFTRGITIPGYLAPNIFGLADGGMHFGEAINAAAQIMDGTAGILNQTAGVISTKAMYNRRREDWVLQRDLAKSEMKQIQGQLLANMTRRIIMERELAIHKNNIRQAQEYEKFLVSDKFTKEELYFWMVGRITTLYDQTYRLALEMALMAQQAYQFELNREQDAFIEFNYWDSLKKGLMAGEGLMVALERMEQAYLQNNKRHLEIEKTISLAKLDCQALFDLKTKGVCEFKLTEALFDYDYPGHYLRRIKTIAISIPAVVGPYQNIKATLSQEKSTIITDAASTAPVEYLLGLTENRPDSGLKDDWRKNEQVALSRGVDDSGLFVLDFRDERYLPFEGTGAVSTWKLRMPRETNHFDFDGLSDVIIQLKYTALAGGDKFRTDVQELLKRKPLQEAYYLNLKQNYVNNWQAFITARAEQDSQEFVFALAPDIFRFYPKMIVDTVCLKLDLADNVSIPDGCQFMTLKIGADNPRNVAFINGIGMVSGLKLTGDNMANQFFADWHINVEISQMSSNSELSKLLKDGFLDAGRFKNIEVIIGCQAYVWLQK